MDIICVVCLVGIFEGEFVEEFVNVYYVVFVIFRGAFAYSIEELLSV